MKSPTAKFISSLSHAARLLLCIIQPALSSFADGAERRPNIPETIAADGKLRLDYIDEQLEADRIKRGLYDFSSPEFKPAKPVDVAKKKGWKRKLVAWCFVLLLIGGGAIALYLLLRVNRVDVKVQADSRRELQTPKPSPNANNPDNTLTAEAINIARSARHFNVILRPFAGSIVALSVAIAFGRR